MRYNRAGRMDTAREFIALLTCGVWDRLLAERRAISLESICGLADEDCDRFALLLLVWSGHYHCFDDSKRGYATKNETDPGEKSRDGAACLDYDLTRNRR